MPNPNYSELMKLSLPEIADKMEAGELPYPSSPSRERPGYPSFPNALRDVIRRLAEDTYLCIVCGMPNYYYPADKAYAPGHCYSEAGVKEVGISGTCEFCFDNMFEEPEVDDAEAEAVWQSRKDDPARTQPFEDLLEGLEDDIERYKNESGDF